MMTGCPLDTTWYQDSTSRFGIVGIDFAYNIRIYIYISYNTIVSYSTIVLYCWDHKGVDVAHEITSSKK